MSDLATKTKTRAAGRPTRLRLAMVLVAALTAMAVLVPTASARPAGAAAGAAIAHPGSATGSTSTGSPASASSSDDWGIAAVGAGAGLAVLRAGRPDTRRSAGSARVSAAIGRRASASHGVRPGEQGAGGSRLGPSFSNPTHTPISATGERLQQRPGHGWHPGHRIGPSPP